MSNYIKKPSFPILGNVFSGWNTIITELQNKIKDSTKNRFVVVIECYHGVHQSELLNRLNSLSPNLFVNSLDAFYSEEEILRLTYPYVTDDAIFGYMSDLSYRDFIDNKKLNKVRYEIEQSIGLVLVYGHGAALIAEKYDCLVYADMPRWEIQLRQRKHEVANLGISNQDESSGTQYKRSYFVDWRVCDKLKQGLFEKADYWLDSTITNEPKMIYTQTLLDGLSALVKTPFRLVPYFDPGPWGGQWMKEVCGLDKSMQNYAWSFDGVPEENSLLFDLEGELFEIPSINLVFYKSKELLGAHIESRFGKEFPIRFDFLDTMEGGILSLQVHPSTKYIHDKFGMQYTQDESYYMLDAKPDATVYLGLKTGIDAGEMLSALNIAQKDGVVFDAEKYINVFPAKKHDHFLIPNGTIHCSGSNSMVLEISATPYIFTFKLYDWARMGMDGKPRPINIEHGAKVIQWERNTEYCLSNLVGQVELLAEGDGWREERTGLHALEFIETRRHWFTKTVNHHTGNTVNVLNLIEGKEAIVESPAHLFKPFVVHYAETFIIPAVVGEYSIRPYGESVHKQCATIKAFVRN